MAPSRCVAALNMQPRQMCGQPVMAAFKTLSLDLKSNRATNFTQRESWALCANRARDGPRRRSSFAVRQLYMTAKTQQLHRPAILAIPNSAGAGESSVIL